MKQLLNEMTIQDYLNNPDFVTRIVESIYDLERISEIDGHDDEIELKSWSEIIAVMKAYNAFRENNEGEKIYNFLKQ